MQQSQGQKHDVILLCAMFHCVRAFTFDNITSTSTTNYKCRWERKKNKKRREPAEFKTLPLSTGNYRPRKFS